MFETNVKLPVGNMGFGHFPKCDTIMNRICVISWCTQIWPHSIGWVSLKYRRYLCMLKFWNRLIQLDDTRLVKRIFLHYIRRSWGNWCSDIQHIADIFVLNHVLNEHYIFDIDSIKAKCADLMNIEWRQQVESKPKLRTYVTFKHVFGLEPYLKYNISRYNISSMAQFRTGILPLQIEFGSFNNIRPWAIRKLSPQERICTICDSGFIDDEKHFVFNWNMYHARCYLHKNIPIL